MQHNVDKQSNSSCLRVQVANAIITVETDMYTYKRFYLKLLSYDQVWDDSWTPNTLPLKVFV